MVLNGQPIQAILQVEPLHCTGVFEMSEYGYIPEAPEQSFGNNKGIFNPKDIYDLTRADKYTNYGQLELIETQTASADSSLDFISLGSYNVHFLSA